MFGFPTLDEAALEDLKEIGAAPAVAQRKEAMEVYYTLSCDFRDAFSELEIMVLKPLCGMTKMYFGETASDRSFGADRDEFRQISGRQDDQTSHTQKVSYQS